MVAVAAFGGVALAIKAAEHRLGPPPIAAANDLSAVVLDRDGRLLRAFTTSDGRWRLPVTTADVDPRYVQMLFAFEDKNFHHHSGVDYRAMLRAVAQLALNGRIVSGASTLTMQVARLLEGRHEKSAIGKFKQIVRARQIEARWS